MNCHKSLALVFLLSLTACSGSEEQNTSSSDNLQFVDIIDSSTDTVIYDVFEYSGANIEDSGTMSMTIDYNEGRVHGSFSVLDNENREWFATFSGYIEQTSLVLVVEFAARDLLSAIGSINAEFISIEEGVNGNLELTLENDDSASISLSFTLKPAQYRH